MQTEKEFLFEIYQALDAIHRSTDELRKQEMKNHLHKKLYPKKYRYGFSSIEEVRKSVEHLKAGKSDPSQKQRYENLKRTIGILTEVLSDYEKNYSRQKEPKLSLYYDRLKDRSGTSDLSKNERNSLEDLERE